MRQSPGFPKWSLFIVNIWSWLLVWVSLPGEFTFSWMRWKDVVANGLRSHGQLVPPGPVTGRKSRPFVRSPIPDDATERTGRSSSNDMTKPGGQVR